MILERGKNCWRIERASRASFLIDAADYFARFREVVGRARRSVLIIGWDVDSRTRLGPGDDDDDARPATLLPVLNAALAARPELRVHVLGWDFSMIYAFEREKLPAYRFAWEGHDRLAFELDALHPLGASHHQKLVVVDDRVAFVGGLDLTIRRWDTSRHLAQDAGRVDPAGVLYAPVHDVQMVVEGDVARALGDLARSRWRAATGREPGPSEGDGDGDGASPWPEDLVPDVTDVPLAIARTHPPIEADAAAAVSPAAAAALTAADAAAAAAFPAVREVLQLTLDSIRGARRWIYIETQYLTSAAVGSALATSLEAPAGPEVVVVLPREECGWLEQSSMGVLRARVVARLRQADRHDRLRLYYPAVPDLVAGCVNVHSKVMVVDDELARVGSANLSNRSMGLDTECDLALDADGDPRRRAGVALLRDRLLGEHLGVDPAEVTARIGARGSLIAAIESLRGDAGTRTLAPLPAAPDVPPPALNLAVLDGLVCDPERAAPEALLDAAVPHELRHPLRRSLVRYAIAAVALVALAALWRHTPLSSYLDADRMAEAARQVRGSPLAPLWVVGGYLLGALVFFPITLMLTATALVFPTGESIAYSLAGTLSAAALTFGLGRLLAGRGRPPPRLLRGPRVSRLRRQLAAHGVLAVVAARLLPVGSFSLINMIAGAIPLRFRDFMLGNALGILPGVIGLSLFAQGLGRALRSPGPQNLTVLALLAAALIGALGWLRRRVARATRAAQSDAGDNPNGAES